jgi:phage antirepressor YoqD-like protein
MSNQIFKYNGNNITFQLGNGDVMVNATEMAKGFDKNPSQFFRTENRSEFIHILGKRLKINHQPNFTNEIFNSARDVQIKYPELVVVKQGGNDLTNTGIWFHEDLALEFARWLSPAFAIWCNDKIKELIKNGYTKLDSITRKDLAKMLFEAEEEKERLELEKHELEIQNKILKPKAELMDKVVDTDELMDIGQVAKVLKLPFGRNKLFEKLRSDGIFFKNRNEPKQEFVEKGLFFLKINLIERDNHEPFTVLKTLVSKKGLVFLSKHLGSNPTLPGLIKSV